MERLETANQESVSIPLLEGEKIISVQTFEPPKPSKRLSTLKEMYRLTGATNKTEVGLNGPAVAALSLETGGGSPEAQGLYGVVFGRDSLRVAIDLVDHYPQLARATLQRLAETQGINYNPAREEEPGRIAHELREPQDPIAQRLTAERGWRWPYYGSVDATPEFVRTLAAYCHVDPKNENFLFTTYTDAAGTTRPIHEALMRAVDWMVGRMDQNPEGLLEYKAAIPKGIENQVWKDSWDAYHHADGTIANHDQGIASIEVQSVTHDALLDAANLYESTLGKHHEAAQLRERAATLAKRVLTDFWTDDKGGYFVLGLDRDDAGKPRQLKIRTSNMGHVLNSRILDGADEERLHKRNAVLAQLQSPELLAVSGVRTLASDEVRYREGTYHNGSVWIWDTHHIAKGARRHTDDPAFGTFADMLDRRILQAVHTIGGFPEYVRGGDSIAINTQIIDIEDTINHRINRIEQPPQEVQAWTVAAILASKYEMERRRHATTR